MAVLILGLVQQAYGLAISNRYSPRNDERPKRKSTTAIILHTTEGSATGSLNKLRKNGEAHYFVDTDGSVYRIIERDRVAYHCGRSMWEGATDLDRHTVGIEAVDYHHQEIHSAQYTALKELVAELQGIYRVPDERVLTHSMVAYGKPNRWHRHSHRGRKRCGMLFATQTVRERLGLTRGPAYDPDVKSGRLAVGDADLADVLYGGVKTQSAAAERFTSNKRKVISGTRSAWDIARTAYQSATTLYRFPDGTEKQGNQIRNWKALPAGTRVTVRGETRDNEPEGVKILGEDGYTAWETAGHEYNASTTLYFLPDGTIRAGDKMDDRALKGLPVGTRLLVGYVMSGRISARRSAFDICGMRWNLVSTYYGLADGALVDGSSLNEHAIPKGAHVFLAR